MVFKVKAARSPVTLCAAATGARLPPAEFMADLAADPFLTRAAKSADARRTAALGVAALVGFVGDSLPGRGVRAFKAVGATSTYRPVLPRGEF